MSNEELGIKRTCLKCAARFYDFNKSPIVCPACGEIFDPEYLLKRKSRNSHERTEEVDDIDLDINDDNLMEDASDDDMEELDSDIELEDSKN